jgi:hypothetical protein
MRFHGILISYTLWAFGWYWIKQPAYTSYRFWAIKTQIMSTRRLEC